MNGSVTRRQLLRQIALGAGGVALLACAPRSALSGGGVVRLTGAGSTFVYPLFSKLFDEYQKMNPQVRVNYQSVGSGAGIRQLLERTVDFGATDAPMTDEQLREAPGPIVHLPVTLGAVVVVFNLSGLTTLRLDGPTLAGLFLGEIGRWNDPRLQALNPDVALPNQPVAVVHRSDGSGTTYIFTAYLSAVSAAWRQRVGVGTAVAWPVGLGAKGNEGVAGQVRQTPGAVGYVELTYASQNNLPMATLRNRAGAWVEPRLPAITAAAASLAQIPEDLRFLLVDMPGAEAYPLVGVTWVLLYQEAADPVKGRALAELFWWVLHEGQRYAAPLQYAPLPPGLVERGAAKLRQLTHRGQPLLSR